MVSGLGQAGLVQSRRLCLVTEEDQVRFRAGGLKAPEAGLVARPQHAGGLQAIGLARWLGTVKGLEASSLFQKLHGGLMRPSGYHNITLLRHPYTYREKI